ncbi:MAG: OmpA family protein [Alphaproteobacteria bacterium]|jgi:peptidoglycan-associated lipoprotein|nr:OmpA family protein [Alphaproteobacteria bacterium]
MKTVKSLFLLLGMLILTACASAPVSDDGTAPTTPVAKDAPVVATVEQSETYDKVKGYDPIVLFDFDKSVIRADQAPRVAGQASKAKSVNSKAITVEGHTDPIGTKEYNLALGERRANSTKNALVKNGVNKDIIDVVSYGKERLVDTSGTAEGNAKNRRTVTILK